MFVGVSRQRWIASGMLIVLGLAIFISSGSRFGIAGGLVGIVLALLGLVLIGMTPRHHPPAPAPAPTPKPAAAQPAPPPAPRPDIEARDASEV